MVMARPWAGNDAYSSRPTIAPFDSNQCLPQVPVHWGQDTVHFVWTYEFSLFRLERRRDLLVHTGRPVA